MSRAFLREALLKRCAGRQQPRKSKRFIEEKTADYCISADARKPKIAKILQHKMRWEVLAPPFDLPLVFVEWNHCPKSP